jgi:hypothetical protein
MSKLFVDEIVHQSSQGSGTITLGASGETIALASGAEVSGFTGQNYPAFEATLSADQNLPNTTITKVQWNSETFDTDNCYDNTTNYRFTPNIAGKYFVYAQTEIAENNSSALEKARVYIYKNGSSILDSGFDFRANPIIIATTCISTTVICNGTTDYIEIFAFMDSNAHTGGAGERIEYTGSVFGAYRIGA